MRLWLSWYEPAADGDYRPRKWPLPAAIPQYWCTGWRGSEATICAVIDAKSEKEAKNLVEEAGWSPSEWRFLGEREDGWMPPEDRFPRAT